MTLKDIASIAGKSGLYKVLKPSRTGVLLESIDEKKAKMIANAQQRVSILKEVSIYANNAEGSVPLRDVFLKIQEKHGEKISLDTSNNKALLGFIAEIVPEYDTEKVYASDIKKLVNWYNILAQYCPAVFTAEEAIETTENADSADTTAAEATNDTITP
jgi:sporulation protein YlmC with PRC-barrel domain